LPSLIPPYSKATLELSFQHLAKWIQFVLQLLVPISIITLSIHQQNSNLQAYESKVLSSLIQLVKLTANFAACEVFTLEKIKFILRHLVERHTSMVVEQAVPCLVKLVQETPAGSPLLVQLLESKIGSPIFFDENKTSSS